MNAQLPSAIALFSCDWRGITLGNTFKSRLKYSLRGKEDKLIEGGRNPQTQNRILCNIMLDSLLLCQNGIC